MRDPLIEIVVSGKNAQGSEVVLKKSTSEANASHCYKKLLELLDELTKL